MLAISSYEKDYVDTVRARIGAVLDAYDGVAAGAKVDTFEPLFFNHLVMALDDYFGHRQRSLEKKDGNPLNEVRMICASMIENDGVLASDKTIKWSAETSVLGYAIGDTIAIDRDGFARLSDAFLAEIETKYA